MPLQREQNLRLSKVCKISLTSLDMLQTMEMLESVSKIFFSTLVRALSLYGM